MTLSYAKKAFTVMAMMAAAPALASEYFPVITPENPNYLYYARAANLDESYIRNHMIGNYYPFNSDDYFKPVQGSEPVEGRVVQFFNGNNLNPLNLVISINGNIYFVKTELTEMSERVTLARRWLRGNNGIFLIVRGFRAGAIPRERMPVRITIRIAKSMGTPLRALEYIETVGNVRSLAWRSSNPRSPGR